MSSRQAVQRKERFGSEPDQVMSRGVSPWRHLEDLESEAIHILREVAAEFGNPVLLFSAGKDSTVLLRLAEKAFRPGRFPFPLMHVDTGHNFPEVIDFRDRVVARIGERLIVASVQQSIDSGRIKLKHPNQSRNACQTVTLLDAIAERKRPAPRSASSPSATSSAPGIRAASGPSCGVSITRGSIPVSICGSSR
jgi:3'-phosphoadenosine 5'-phosphosulfate sulfotransferase (PAPS reductase)/FAD synthetase